MDQLEVMDAGRVTTPPDGVQGVGQAEEAAVTTTVLASPVAETAVPVGGGTASGSAVGLDVSPQALDMLPPEDAAGGLAAAAAAAGTPPQVADAGGSSAGAGETGLVQMHPSLPYLRDRPAVIGRILKQAPTIIPQVSRLVFDERADGTLADEGALSSGSPGTQERLKTISIIRTPAEGVKHMRVRTPRPSCQWYAPSVAVVDFTTADSAAPAAAAVATAVTAAEPPHSRTYKMDTSKKVPSWRMNGNKAFTGVEGLFKWSFTPEGTDDDYIKGQRMTLYELETAPRFYLMVVHSPQSNNAKHRRNKGGKKRTAVSDSDREKAVRDFKRACTNLKAQIGSDAGQQQKMAAIEQEFASLQDALSSDVVRGGGAPVSSDVTRGGGAPVVFHSSKSNDPGTEPAVLKMTESTQ
eukprot:COSAG02_NODE_11291_length_1754_cov_1.326284_1_plen_409_part_10